MVKGLSRRVIVVEAPDQTLFEQAIFILRNDALSGNGISADQVVYEACRIARDYASNGGKRRKKHTLPAPLYAAIGAGGIGLLWLATFLL